MNHTEWKNSLKYWQLSIWLRIQITHNRQKNAQHWITFGPTLNQSINLFQIWKVQTESVMTTIVAAILVNSTQELTVPSARGPLGCSFLVFQISIITHSFFLNVLHVISSFCQLFVLFQLLHYHCRDPTCCS